MKSQKEYAKLEKDYAAMERNRKRYKFLFAILAMVGLGFSIFFFIEFLKDNYSIFVFLSILTLTLIALAFMILYIFRMHIAPKKIPLLKNMEEEYKKKNIRRALSKLELKDSKNDAYLDPHGYVVIVS
jgi:ABC-type bacteriocin/lantibiotic exporter with double-glycine peptidase domain